MRAMNKILMISLAAALTLMASSQLGAQQRGDWVLAQWRGGEFWFPGVVDVREGNAVTIAYDDGTRETLPVKSVRPYTWTEGSRIECLWAGGKEWYAARITKMGKDGSSIDVIYDADGVYEQTRTGACRSR